MKLPARIVSLKQAEFSDEERAFYNNLENESRKQFQVLIYIHLSTHIHGDEMKCEDDGMCAIK